MCHVGRLHPGNSARAGRHMRTPNALSFTDVFVNIDDGCTLESPSPLAFTIDDIKTGRMEGTACE